VVKFLIKNWYWILCSIPALTVFYFILKYHVNIPFWDEWEIVYFLEKFHQGTLTLADLWQKHNEHRTFFPQIIIIALARLSSWNMLLENILNFIIASGTFLVITRLFKRVKYLVGLQETAFLIPLVALLVYSLRQWENWTWGIQMVCYMATFGAVTGIVILSGLRFYYKNLWVAAFFGILSTFSFSSGVVFWPISLFLICFNCFSNNSTRYRVIVIWLIFSLVVLSGYFYDFERLDNHPSLAFGLLNPVEFFHYFFSYLGSPINFSKSAYIYGIFAFLIFNLQFIFLLLYCKKKEYYLGFISLGLFSLGNAFITALGRSGFGSIQSLSPRYVTISYIFWVGLIGITAVTFKLFEQRWTNTKRLIKSIYVVFLVTMYIVFIRVSLESIKPFKERYEMLKIAAKELYVLKDEHLLGQIYPDPQIVKVLTAKLRTLNLCIFYNN